MFGPYKYLATPVPPALACGRPGDRQILLKIISTDRTTQARNDADKFSPLPDCRVHAIVNAEQRLVGMVTQSDLIAALYAGGSRFEGAMP
jgi:CBS-domain-containing membrane protein